jgi:uncharacterized protein YkwD
MISSGRMRARGHHHGRVVAASLTTTLLVAALTVLGAPAASGAKAEVTRAATSHAAAEIGLQRRVVRVTNRRREAHGLPRLRVQRCPRGFAVRHSTRMAVLGRLGHSNLQRLSERCSTGHVAENVASFTGSAPTARRVVRTWMRSPGHRANILDPSLTHLGVGVVRAGHRWYVTQDFLAR